MKNGLIFENGELIYYKDDKPKHTGVIRVDGDIYYISSQGRAVKGEHIVHREMGNDILKRGTYTFGDDYKLVKGSYIAPKKRKKKGGFRKSLGIKPKNAYKAKNEKQRKQKWMAVLAGAGFLLLMIVALLVDPHFVATEKPEPDSKTILPSFEEDVLLCSGPAKMEYDGETELSKVLQTGNPYRPFRFTYRLENKKGTLQLGERKDLSDAKSYPLTEEQEQVFIDNLKVDTTYYYQVTVEDEVYTGSFHTAAAPRFLSIPGLVNTRDIGGGFNQDGQQIKQGMIIRGVELDGLANPSYYIPEEALTGVQDTFGFRYDFDLREGNLYSGTYSSRLGVPHKFYAAPQYGEIFSVSYRDSLRTIFSDLANADHYPMYLHCTWGADRTGTIVFLLQGLLNMSEEDMIREYGLTGYYREDNWAESMKINTVINGLKPYAGDTLQEKIVTFLTTEIGVTEEEIASIRSILLES